MKSRTLFSLLLLFACLAVLFSNGNAQTNNEQQTVHQAQVKKLLVERRDALREQLAALEALHVGGKLDMAVESMTQVRNDLLAAELELAADKPARIKLYEERLRNSRQLEAVVKQKVVAGLETSNRYYAAKAARLQAEIELIREQSGTQ